ncbi:hypothetical protein K438DRAFT_1787237 [Mycena galopus ATCC 62051]|nr:hypothetical protein K438DRAFT_1787237 [Mycena galopus ATCC 62051]
MPLHRTRSKDSGFAQPDNSTGTLSVFIAQFSRAAPRAPSESWRDSQGTSAIPISMLLTTSAAIGPSADPQTYPCETDVTSVACQASDESSYCAAMEETSGDPDYIIPSKRWVDGADPNRRKRRRVAASEDEDLPRQLHPPGDRPPVPAGLDSPVQPHTWARPVGTTHPACGKVVLVISCTEYLYVPLNEEDEQAFVQFFQCEVNPSGYSIGPPEELTFFTGRQLVPVVPTEDVLCVYRRINNEQTLCIPATWHSPALSPGDRVAVMGGEFAGAAGCIVTFHQRDADIWAELVRAEWDVVSPSEHFTVKLQDLARHAFDLPSVPFNVQDRIRVVLGVMYWGAVGHVVQIANDMLTIGVPRDYVLVGPTTDSPFYSRMKIFKVPIYNVVREFWIGDWVRAVSSLAELYDFMM